jgi:uncharacterized membrane protein YoaK (UPF0700 family)
MLVKHRLSLYAAGMKKGDRTLSIGIAALAGYVDAIGFLQLGGFFVSFMSGNSTRLSVSLARGLRPAWVAAVLIVTFVIGVIIGSLIGHFAREHRRPVVLALASVLLAGAAALGVFTTTGGAIGVMTLAMGAVNTVFEDNQVANGPSYINRAEDNPRRALVGAFLRESRLYWIPTFFLWISLVTGGVAGAAIFSQLGLSALWVASAASALFAILTWTGGARKHSRRQEETAH